jgi:hypothetical protein
MKRHLLSLSLMATFAFPVFAAPQMVGKVSFAKGSNAAQQPNSAPRLLGKEAEIYQGDNIQTADASFVIVEFTDGSKVTVRPNSNFKIEQFDNSTKNAKLTVYEGGVRASTGEFSKAGAENFQIKTPTSTLKGAKDSDYSVRVCNHDCENKKDISVAKIVDIKGDVFAENHAEKNAAQRKLSVGSGLNPQDYLVSQPNSYALMVFRDGEKVTLQANSQLDIVKYNFNETGKKDQIMLKLAAGGMRALTGKIGKTDRSAYAVDTPVATIGIRGTEYEVSCIGDCVGSNDSIEKCSNENGGESDCNEQKNKEGMYSHVTEGAISQTNETGETVLTQGQNSFISNPTTLAIPVSTLPAVVTESLQNTPSPKTAPSPDTIFSPSDDKTKVGSYVIVNKGSGELESNSLEINEKDSHLDDKNLIVNAPENREKNNISIVLSEGESSFSGSTTERAVKLDESPVVITQDETLSSEIVKLSGSPITNLLSSNTPNTTKVDSTACVVE